MSVVFHERSLILLERVPNFLVHQILHLWITCGVETENDTVAGVESSFTFSASGHLPGVTNWLSELSAPENGFIWLLVVGWWASLSHDLTGTPT
jgi:hypothetical protein